MSVALVHRPSVARSLTTRSTVTTGTRTGSVGPSMKPLTRLALDSCGSPGLWIETSPTSPPTAASPTSTASLRIQRDVAPAQLRASTKRRKRDDLSPGAAAAAVSENSLVFAPTSRTSGLRIPAGDPGPGKPHSILMRRSFAGVQPDRGHLVPDHMAVRLHSEPDRVGSGAIPSGRRVDDTAERQVPVQTVRHREPRPAADPPDASGDHPAGIGPRTVFGSKRMMATPSVHPHAAARSKSSSRPARRRSVSMTVRSASADDSAAATPAPPTAAAIVSGRTALGAEQTDRVLPSRHVVVFA